MRYKIEVSMNPNYEDSANCPYFWIIRSVVETDENSDWCTITAGWARTPTDAWQQAYLFWDDITST